MPWLLPPLWLSIISQAEERTHRLRPEEVEAIVQRAEEWAREAKIERAIARLAAVRAQENVRVPVDWRERGQSPQMSR